MFLIFIVYFFALRVSAKIALIILFGCDNRLASSKDLVLLCSVIREIKTSNVIFPLFFKHDVVYMDT